MYLKDVLTREETEIFDTNDLLADSYAWQTHISTNEQVISFTLKRNSDYSTVGCAVYFVHNSSFVLFDGAECKYSYHIVTFSRRSNQFLRHNN